jgi:hypothetical protein
MNLPHPTMEFVTDCRHERHSATLCLDPVTGSLAMAEVSGRPPIASLPAQRVI